MGRVIQTELKRPLADAILFGDLSGGGVAKVSLQDDLGAVRIGQRWLVSFQLLEEEKEP